MNAATPYFWDKNVPRADRTGRELPPPRWLPDQHALACPWHPLVIVRFELGDTFFQHLAFDGVQYAACEL